MGRHDPVPVVTHYPKTEEGRTELSQRAAQIHADAVNLRLKALNCPAKQKLALLKAVIKTCSEKYEEPV